MMLRNIVSFWQMKLLFNTIHLIIYGYFDVQFVFGQNNKNPIWQISC